LNTRQSLVAVCDIVFQMWRPYKNRMGKTDNVITIQNGKFRGGQSGILINYDWIQDRFTIGKIHNQVVDQEKRRDRL